MVFQDWRELKAQRPYENGIWDKKKLFEFLVQSCTRTFREQIDEYFAGYRKDEKLAGLLLDFLLDDDYDGSDSQMAAARYLRLMDREVLKKHKDKLCLVQKNEVVWKRPFAEEDSPEWLSKIEGKANE